MLQMTPQPKFQPSKCTGKITFTHSQLLFEHRKEVLVPCVNRTRHTPMQAVLRGWFSIWPSFNLLVGVVVSVRTWVPIGSIGEGLGDIHHPQLFRVCNCNFLSFCNCCHLVTIQSVHVWVLNYLFVCQWLCFAGARSTGIPCSSFVMFRGIGPKYCQSSAQKEKDTRHVRFL